MATATHEPAFVYLTRLRLAIVARAGSTLTSAPARELKSKSMPDFGGSTQSLAWAWPRTAPVRLSLSSASPFPTNYEDDCFDR